MPRFAASYRSLPREIRRACVYPYRMLAYLLGPVPSANRLSLFVVAVLFVMLAPAPQAGAQSGFYRDVSEGVHYSEPVAELQAMGVFDGTACGEGLFCPDEPVLRWQMAVWIVRVVDGADPEQAPEPRFGDVDAGHWWAAHTERMFQLGITTGCGDGDRFCPYDPVKRSHMAAFVARAFDLAPGSHPGFDDVTLDDWYHDSVIALARAGITQGCDSYDRFCPSGLTLRGQMATFLHRAIHRDETGAVSCDFADHADRVTRAVFQVHGDGLGTAFRVGYGYSDNDERLGSGEWWEEWLTAAHVVGGRRQVTLTNGTISLDAWVVGTDSATDVALLRAKGVGVSYLRFGKATFLKPGADLYAIGYPLHTASQPTVSRGVLSRIEEGASLARTFVSEGTLILTDAPINPGNSGGPLVDTCGSVIGMNVAKATAVDVEGINWAVASSTLQERLSSLREQHEPETSSEPNSVSSGTGSWEYFNEESLWGGYEGYYLLEESHQSRLYVRCAVEGTLYSPEKYDSVFFSTGNLVTNDYRNPDAPIAPVIYRFSDENTVTLDSHFSSNEEPESVLFAYGEFINKLSGTTAEALHIAVTLDNGNDIHLSFNITGIDAVVADLDCLPW